MDALRAYNQATSALLALQAVPLLFAPSMVVWMLSPDPRSVATLESFFARSLAIALLVIAFFTLLLSGELQKIYNAAGGDGSVTTDAPSEMSNSPHAVPTLYATMVYHAVSGMLLYGYSYSRDMSSTWLMLAALAEFGLCTVGILLVMFGQGPGHISKRTGADKRTSGFPFTNAEAEKRKAKKSR